MKNKECEFCKVSETVLFRICTSKILKWIFVCKSCCIKLKETKGYKYGGTWKGIRH